MSVASIADVTNTSSSTGALPTNGLGGQDFLQLLVMQLKNQDPLNPIDDQNFISQMAQLSSLEATNQVSDRVGQMVTNQQQLGAVALVGRDVEYTDSTGSTVQGKVSSLRLGGASPMLRINDQDVPLDQIQAVL
jgi:flagellar basal-body rod modification protein FlgD